MISRKYQCHAICVVAINPNPEHLSQARTIVWNDKYHTTINLPLFEPLTSTRKNIDPPTPHGTASK
jgi:hypothetical protein